MSEESVWNVVPLMRDLLTAEGCSVKGVQNPALPLAGAIGQGAGRRLYARDGGPVRGQCLGWWADVYKPLAHTPAPSKRGTG